MLTPTASHEQILLATPRSGSAYFKPSLGNHLAAHEVDTLSGITILPLATRTINTYLPQKRGLLSGTHPGSS